MRTPMLAAFAVLLSPLTLPIPTASADPLPVIAVNREIGLSMDGLFHDSVQGSHLAYDYMSRSFTGNGIRPVGNPYVYNDQFTTRSQSRNSGWIPGFQADSALMFDAWGVKHLYASAQFVLGDGTDTTKFNHEYSFDVYGSSPFPSPPSGQNKAGKSTMTRGEIGKGFLLLSNRLLLTPVIQGGYNTQGEKSFDDGKHYFFVGVGIQPDYALTKKLVLRGRLAWAETLGTGIYFQQGGNPDHARPRWEAGLGLDYRMSGKIHLTGGVDYSYMSAGHAHNNQSTNQTSAFQDVSVTIDSGAGSFTNGLKLHAGIAYQL